MFWREMPTPNLFIYISLFLHQNNMASFTSTYTMTLDPLYTAPDHSLSRTYTNIHSSPCKATHARTLTESTKHTCTLKMAASGVNTPVDALHSCTLCPSHDHAAAHSNGQHVWAPPATLLCVFSSSWMIVPLLFPFGRTAKWIERSCIYHWQLFVVRHSLTKTRHSLLLMCQSLPKNN